jgi:hypothetical protein
MEFESRSGETPFVPDNEIPFPIHQTILLIQTSSQFHFYFHKRKIEIITCGGIFSEYFFLKMIPLARLEKKYYSKRIFAKTPKTQICK